MIRNRGRNPSAAGPDSTGPTDDHPRGTLFIVGAFGAVVVVGWLLFFFTLFVPRMTP